MGFPQVLIFPLMADMIDEIVVKSNKRQEGTIIAIIFTIINIIPTIFLSLIIAGIFISTGFIPGLYVQSANALLGIRVSFALIPLIFFLVGFLIIFLYDLNVARVINNQESLNSRDLALAK